MLDTQLSSQEFWDRNFQRFNVQQPNLNDPILLKALDYFGEVQGKTVIDLGCGDGRSSLFFAYYGAKVISIDASTVAIDNLTQFCQANNIPNIQPLHLSAQDLDALDPADCIFGSMILHHIEPFDQFAFCLRTAIKPNGRAFFFENNARSRLMIWFRENVIGKLWIPKHGDPDEFPLTPPEVDLLRRYFTVEVQYPTLMLFEMIPIYLFRGALKAPFEWLDRWCYRFPTLRQYSYRQCLYLQ